MVSERISCSRAPSRRAGLSQAKVSRVSVELRSPWCHCLITSLSRQSYPTEDCLSLCQVAGEVRDSAPESLGVRAMGLSGGFGKGTQSVPVESKADG